VYRFSFSILFSSFLIGEGKIKTPPLKDQGWDTKYSTVPPWLQLSLPLIDALTGAPGMAFPHIRLRSGIANGRGTDALHQRWHPLWESYRTRVSSSQPVTRKNLAQNRKFVNPQAKNAPEESELHNNNAGCVL
jgi:hypothetical protein